MAYREDRGSGAVEIFSVPPMEEIARLVARIEVLTRRVDDLERRLGKEIK